MKTSMKSFVFLNVILIAMALTGCREITTTIRIFPDGSCERTVEVRSDSTSVDSVFAGPFPIPVDSTWAVSQKRDKGGDKKFLYTAYKRFNRVSDLRREYSKKDRDPLKAVVDVRLDKRFRWFNTFFKYRETYEACTPFVLVPISDFLTPKELSLYYLKDDTLGLDKKVDQWLLKSYCEELFQVLIHQAEANPVPGLTTETLRVRKDSLFALIRRLDNEKSDKFDDGQKMFRFLEAFYQNKAIRKWSDALGKTMKDIKRKEEFLLELDGNSYVNEVIMPGLILDTNASSVEGNKVLWKLKSNQFYWEDYQMRVESRVVNRWAIWVTAGILLSIITGLVIVVFRK
jgi:hypothetical protein